MIHEYLEYTLKKQRGCLYMYIAIDFKYNLIRRAYIYNFRSYRMIFLKQLHNLTIIRFSKFVIKYSLEDSF